MVLVQSNVAQWPTLTATFIPLITIVGASRSLNMRGFSVSTLTSERLAYASAKAQSRWMVATLWLRHVEVGVYL
jgi:hypothetical protein